MTTGIDLTGQRFGRLLVLEPAARRNGVIWRCRCDCGAEHQVRAGHLRGGNIMSCGCLARETTAATSRKYAHLKVTHGRSHTRLDEAYKNMLRRCYDETNKRFAQYGGRGIRVFEGWLRDKPSFFTWALANGYGPGLTIERKDVNGNYEPGNCCWIPMARQQANTTRSRFLEWNGRRQTVADWSRELGVGYRALQNRVGRNWPVERIFTQPFRGAAR